MKKLKDILASMGIDHHTERHEIELMYDEAVFLNLAISIDNHLKLKMIMADLTALQAEVAQDTSVMNSAVTLIQGLEQKLADAGTDPQKLADLQASLAGSRESLAAAIAANTPADPAADTAAQ